MEIEVGEYVRTENGIIDKVDSLCGMIENTVYLKQQSLWFNADYIVKHSKQLIDLIEVGDYVNGKLIHKIDKGPNYCYLYYGNCKTFVNYQIKSIVTHEQFASIEYKVEEE